MGLYATTTSFSQLLPFMMSGNSTGSDPDTAAVISKHIDRAESVVNAHIVSRYSLPFSTIPPEVRRLSEDIASYFTIRGQYVQDGTQRNQIFEDYERALEELKEIRKGEVGLAETDGTLIATNANARFLSSTEDYTPIFDLDSASAWNVDSDQLDDISDTRD